MHTGQKYKLLETLKWSKYDWLIPLGWSSVVTVCYLYFQLSWIQIPWLPVSLVGVAVAFYLGFKNNASYDRTWEARKIWGAIVNASRSWAFSSRDFVSGHWVEGREVTEDELTAIRHELVLRHVAWMDALRHQLRKVKSWEHEGPEFDAYREHFGAPEYSEDMTEVLATTIGREEAEGVASKINPAANLLANQSHRLHELFEAGYIDSFRHMQLQELLVELMAQQGKAERIKNFPFPRQYSTVNTYFAWLLVALIPIGLCHEFFKLNVHFPALVWLTVPFTTLASWVFLSANRIGDWSENPFEGLANDVPISAMARGIERDIREIVGIEELPPPRQPNGSILM